MASETSWKGATGSWPVPSGEKWSRKDDTLLPSDGWRRAACNRTTAPPIAHANEATRVRSAYACRVVSCRVVWCVRWVPREAMPATQRMVKPDVMKKRKAVMATTPPIFCFVLS